jgi:hypothetical protein
MTVVDTSSLVYHSRTSRAQLDCWSDLQLIISVTLMKWLNQGECYIMTTSFRGGRSWYLELHGSVILPSTVGIGQYNTWHPCNSRYLRKIFLYIVHNHMEYLYNIIYSYKYLESDLIKHCHMIFIHSLGQPLIVRSRSKIHRSRGNSHVILTCFQL